MSVWDSIVGQPRVVEQLRAVSSGDGSALAQSWLICGPPGSGRSNAAVAFAEWLSITFGDQGIRVSCLYPQGVNTNILKGTGDQSIVQMGAAVVRSAGKVLEPEDVAEVAVQVIRDLGACPRPPEGSVVMIGSYDGVHLGHRAVIEEVRRQAERLGARSAVVTFDRHPAFVVRPDSAPHLLTDLEQRLELLAETGVDITVVVHFDE